MRLRIPLILFFSLAGFSLVYYLFIQKNLATQFTGLGEERAALNFGFASVLAAGSFILLILWFILDVSLVKPLAALTRGIERIRREQDLSQRLTVESGDEIGAVSQAFNEMLDEIEDARSEVRDQSFRLGMAEMASGVLHNVRNALTPFAGHLQLAKRTLGGAALDEMRRAAEELSLPAPDAARRADLAQFLRLAVEDLGERLAEATARLENMAQVSKKIEAILVAQGRGAPRRLRKGVLELGQIVRDSLTLVPQGYFEFLEVVIDPSVERAPRVLGDAASLQQVFANLACNAAEAAARAGQGEVRLTIAATAAPGELGEAGPTVETVFGDNGPGFAAEAAECLFERGYSSKLTASGLGLHWCANVVAAMGGRMAASSAGPGSGARFGVILLARSAA